MNQPAPVAAPVSGTDETRSSGARRVFRAVGFSVGVNLALVAVVIAAMQYNYLIPLVVNSPSRYSVIVVPFALGAVFAGMCSFFQYRKGASAVGIIGGIVAGLVLTQFFDDFPVDRSELIEIYMRRIDYIGWGTIVFALLALVASLQMFLRSRAGGPASSYALEQPSEFWILKALVCDLPLVLASTVLALVQWTGIDVAPAGHTDIWYDMMKSVMGADYRVILTPEYLEMGKINRKLSDANFWIGVSLGVTSAQLIAQQLGTLLLELVFAARAKPV